VLITSPKIKTYSSITFPVLAAMADEAAGILVGNGALGCDVSKPPIMTKHGPDAKAQVMLRAYFEHVSPATVTRLRKILKDTGMLSADALLPASRIEDPGWATMWQARFAPLPIGKRFLIVPPWRNERDPARVRIVIRPGQAFGTGHHASTSGTLMALEDLCSAGRMDQALDIGTGSGILAIAMAKLGVSQVLALDIDSTALANAVENARLNCVARRIQFSDAPVNAIRRKFPLITANILSSTLIRMAPELKARLRRGGRLVLAGILRREAASVAAAYLPDLTHVGEHNIGAWTALVFRREVSAPMKYPRR
jgi:ribosomal protein L11 methyltransferase